MNNEIHIICPHCKFPILIMKKDINCAIFRHGTFKHNHMQIPPHSKKSFCDYLSKNNLIYGCGKPFRLLFTHNMYKAIVCDYI